VLLAKLGDQFVRSPLLSFDPSDTAKSLSLPQVDGTPSAVICNRSSIIPQPTDYRVLTELKLPLFIKVDQRAITLVIVNGQLQTMIAAGTLLPGEAEALQARLNEMQLTIQHH